MQKLFDLVNSKLDINISLLEVMLYAFTVINMEERNYDVARGVDTGEVADIRHIMPNRSMGGVYAWEFVVQSITNPMSFDKKHRMNHPLDVMIKPNETIIDHYGTIVN